MLLKGHQRLGFLDKMTLLNSDMSSMRSLHLLCVTDLTTPCMSLAVPFQLLRMHFSHLGCFLINAN